MGIVHQAKIKEGAGLNVLPTPPLFIDSLNYLGTEMSGTPNTADIRANVERVKLWVPLSHE